MNTESTAHIETAAPTDTAAVAQTPLTQKRERIWELDALRGLFILCMTVIHLPGNLAQFGGLEMGTFPAWWGVVSTYGHILFILISGICVTLAARSFRRGVVVFGAGLLISYVTLYMELVMDMGTMRIWFGMLHMLGACMMLYPIFKKLPPWALLLIGISMVGLGLWLRTFRISVDFLFPLGLRGNKIYRGRDYFPLFPGMGWFLIGAFLGKTLYRRKTTLLPKVNSHNPILRFFQFCGRHSLFIYLAHQPVFTLISLLIFH